MENEDIPAANERTPMQRTVRYTLLLVGVAVLYVIGIFLWRWHTDYAAAQRAKEKALQTAKADVVLNGGDTLKILALNASPGVVKKGKDSQICYAVANAKKVSFNPPIGDVWPSMAGRCLDVTPKTSTTYTMTVEDAAGHTDTAQIAIEVK